MTEPRSSIEAGYLNRLSDARMIRLIESHIEANTSSIIDIGCGSGIYGATLSKKTGCLIGIDISDPLCEAAKATGYYRKVIRDSVLNIRQYLACAEAIFCSEVLEHFATDSIPSVLNAIHELSPKELVFTVPNPRSPHYRHDPTHIARYSLSSMLHMLNADKRYRYSLLALGFSEQNLGRSRLCRLFNPACSRVASLSPTVAYWGKPSNRPRLAVS